MSVVDVDSLQAAMDSVYHIVYRTIDGHTSAVAGISLSSTWWDVSCAIVAKEAARQRLHDAGVYRLHGFPGCQRSSCVKQWLRVHDFP